MSNGSNSVRNTHRNYWVAVMTFAVLWLALGLNFLILDPTFLIYGAPNRIWAAIFFVFAVAQMLLLNLRYLRYLRWQMTVTVGYLVLLAAGTSQPFLDGEGSLQLPIMYIGMSTLMVPWIAEPPSNPSTMTVESN